MKMNDDKIRVSQNGWSKRGLWLNGEKVGEAVANWKEKTFVLSAFGRALSISQAHFTDPLSLISLASRLRDEAQAAA